MWDHVQAREPVAPARPLNSRRRRLVKTLLAAGILLLLVLVLPPLISVNRYRNRISELIASSLGRPVRLSSVKIRLLPWPGFVLSDLSVSEDPAYGAEPVLHAGSVTASIGLLGLWRGRLDIGSISVDDASLNLVRAAPGKWNLDSLFRTAVAKAGSTGEARRDWRLPYLEATNSRINIKNQVEKLPFSLVNTDLEFWQENSGEWRLRLRGQPARTDVSLYQEDTGVVRLEATVHRAASLRELPVDLDLDWRQAQLGQLSRLVTGSDPGWRGDLTGELHLEGTADRARMTARLRATGVHRAEFAPAEPMDFDANCSLIYHYSRREVEDLACNSPLADGRVGLTADLPNEGGLRRISFELDHISLAAGLDALRTLRSDVPPDLDVKGTVSGKISYAPEAEDRARPVAVKAGRRASAKAQTVAWSPLTGNLTVDDFELNETGLTHPIQIPKIVLDSGSVSSPSANSPEALTATVALPAGGSAPLSLNLNLTRSGYQVAMRGPVDLARAKELFAAAGLAHPAGLDSLTADPVLVDLSAEGPWLPSQQTLEANRGADAEGNVDPSSPQPEGADDLMGTVLMHDAQWKSDFLAQPVVISAATLHLGGGQIRWDPVDFSYGAVTGTASLTVPISCTGRDSCRPHFNLDLGRLDAAQLEAAILGGEKKGTLLSSLLKRLHPPSAPPWPELEGEVGAQSLELGPVELDQPAVELHITPTGAEITNLQGALLGGRVKGSGTIIRPVSDEDQPAFTFQCQFVDLNPSSVGRLIDQRWSGGTLNGNGKVELAGYSDRDLAGSAKGTLRLAWRRGAVIPMTAGAGGPDSADPPAVLAHFDLWTAEATIGDNQITLGENQVRQGSRRGTIEATLTFGDPPSVQYASAEPHAP
jgi:AsmA family